jgi:hypothetical protein
MHAMRNPLRQTLVAAVAGVGLALGLAFPAHSLTADEAGKVSALLAQLSSELGDFAYDDEEADRIFDEDEAASGRIRAAGFDRDEWKQAVDAVFRGYLATIPTDVFSARLGEAMQAIDSMSQLSAEQLVEVRSLNEEKIAEIQLLRAEGAAHAKVVAPYAAQVEAAFDTGLGPAD